MKNEDLKKIRYKNNFLKNVIFRLDYENILKLTQKEHIIDFQDKIREKYPIFEVQYSTYANYYIDTNKVEKETIPLWIFFNKVKDIKISINSTSLTIERFNYSHFPDFKQIITTVYQPFLDLYKPSLNKLGLRYINEIKLEGNAFDWDSYINPNLTKAIDDFVSKEDKNNLSKAMGQIIFNQDDYELRFNYGLFNSKYPNKISDKEFLLDLDCTSTEITTDNMYEYIEKFNLEILSLFEKSIENKTREEMEKIKHE